MQDVDVVVLGAGMAGASVAWRLAPSVRVLVIEREAQPGMHSTGRSAAMFMESYGPPAVRALTRASRQFYEQPPAGFCESALLQPRGALYVAQHGQQAAMQHLHADLAPTCPDLQVLDAAATVVNAAGAWADEVGALFGAPAIGLVPHRRSAFTFRAPEGVDASGWPAVVGVDESYYFKPDAGQLLGSPANADPTVPHDVQPEELDIATGIHQIEQATTLEIRRPTSTWAGLRSFVPDGELVIGSDPLVPGLFWLAAQGGYGIQSAAGASQLAASLLLGQPLPDELRQHGVDPAVVSPARLGRRSDPT